MSIHIEDLTVRFKNSVTAIDHADLDIPNGIFGLLGENGAGKTTLMRVLTTVLKPTNGMVTLDGILYSEGNYEKIQRKIGYADTTISVYDHGYVLYTAGNQSTVFPLHSCDDYEYVSVTGDNKEFNKEFFDNENWYIRLLMEAEDRMAYSQSKISTNHGVFSNSDVTDDAEIMRGSSKDFVDDVIDREILNALIKELTERQKTVPNLIYFEEMRQQDVADYLGIKQQSVNDLLNRALKTMKKKAENEEF